MSNSESGSNPQETDPPIIVQGGNSVDVDVPNKFKDKGPDGKGGKKFRNDDRDLAYLTIDGKRYDLHEKSTIEIYYAPQGGGKAGA